MTWTVLSGVVEWWADEGLRDAGRRRFHESRGRDRSAEELLPRGSIDQETAAFVARRAPWRLALVTVQAASSRAQAEVVSWADDATVVLHGSPASGRVLTANESWGDLGARRLLCPDRLEQVIARPWPPRFDLDGHLLEQDMSVLPELVSLGTDHYEVTYDPKLDVLTSWTAFLDGEVAARQQLRHLTRVDA